MVGAAAGKQRGSRSGPAFLFFTCLTGRATPLLFRAKRQLSENERLVFPQFHSGRFLTASAAQHPSIDR
jgi:hypothetical protein